MKLVSPSGAGTGDGERGTGEARRTKRAAIKFAPGLIIINRPARARAARGTPGGHLLRIVKR